MSNLKGKSRLEKNVNEKLSEVASEVGEVQMDIKDVDSSISGIVEGPRVEVGVVHELGKNGRELYEKYVMGMHDDKLNKQATGASNVVRK